MKFQKSGVIDLDASDISEVSSIGSDSDETENQSGDSLNDIDDTPELSPDENEDELKSQGMTEQQITTKLKERLEKKVAW